MNASRSIQYREYSQGEWRDVDAALIVETPVSLSVNGVAWLTFLCTPVDLEALAAGFLYNEGIIENAAEIASLRVCESGDNVDVWLHHAAEKPQDWRRTSGCTGGVTAVNPRAPRQGLHDEHTFAAARIQQLIGQLFEAQDLYKKAGGVHTSALSDGERVLFASEDIGRHNTLDKISGRMLLEDLWPERKVLLTTGRVSSEMLQKAARLGAPLLISRTSPSSLSVQLAEQWGITLIGYAHHNHFNLYTHPERVLTASNS